VDTYESIQVVAVNNGSTNYSLLGSAFNAITVGRSDGVHAQGSVALDSLYTAGRTVPDLVAPRSTTSGATPVVASTSALLVQVGHEAAQGVPTLVPTGNGGETAAVYDGERSEVIRAALMAGADRATANQSIGADVTDYRVDPAHRTDNGLDNRYGAGQVNVYDSYMIIAAGEQDSLEDGGAMTVPWSGFDYDAEFGGLTGSNLTSTYDFDTSAQNLRFAASLVWNLEVVDGLQSGFDPVATLYDLNLYLLDVTDEPFLVAESASDGDNTENLWLELSAGRDYQLLVTKGDGQADFDWDYALAWTAVPVPLPASAWLLFSAVGVLAGFGRRRRPMGITKAGR
jgi:hypothetical protein